MLAQLVFAALAGGSASGVSALPTEITLDEAKALVAFVPEVRDTTKDGLTVRVTDIDVSSFNRTTYFGLYVAVPNPISSGIVGRYAVNKKTADLWDLLLGAWVCSPEITARQQDLRLKHRISAEVIKQFGDVPMLRTDESAGKQVCRENRSEAK